MEKESPEAQCMMNESSSVIWYLDKEINIKEELSIWVADSVLMWSWEGGPLSRGSDS